MEMMLYHADDMESLQCILYLGVDNCYLVVASKCKSKVLKVLAARNQVLNS